ncbi:MAG TPA: hypothetical protein VGB70_00170 [Allosphingosinicella sp.]|jgi:hypothetical protein
MKKLLIAASALGAIAAAAPAAAQYSNQNNQGVYANVNAGGAVGVQNRLARLEARIQAGVQNGTIDRTEARTLRQNLRTITRLERQYSRNGLSQQERQDLQQRVRSFRDQLAMADGQRGNGLGGYNNGGYSAQGGPYEAYCEDTGSQGGLGGILDSIFGGNNNNRECETGVRVGQRVSGNLYAVPSHLRYRYRDGGGVIYRSDGRNILQIDARTNTVLRIYDSN